MFDVCTFVYNLPNLAFIMLVFSANRYIEVGIKITNDILCDVFLAAITVSCILWRPSVLIADFLQNYLNINTFNCMFPVVLFI